MTDAPIIFHCECGTKLTAPAARAGQRGKCRSCGKPVVVPSTAKTATKKVAAKKTVETCGICTWTIDDPRTQIICPSCGLKFHSDCWQDNKGCSAYGCDQVNILGDASDVEKPPADATAEPVVAMDEPDAPFPWEYALLAGGLIGSLAGAFLFGIPAFAAAVAAVAYLVKSKTCKRAIVILALAVSVIGLIAGIALSRFWWLGGPGRGTSA